MGASLNSYKMSLKQVLYEVLDEVLDGAPFKVDFTFEDQPAEVKSDKFTDPKQNIIQVIFYRKGKDYYDLDFTVNGSSVGTDGLSYSIGEYSNLLSTVAAAVSNFLLEYKPYAISIEGLDSPGKTILKPGALNQKNRIYKYFITQLEDNPNYGVLYKSEGEFEIVLKSSGKLKK